RKREPNMIDSASGTRLRVRLLGENKPGTAEHKPVRTLREPAPPEVLLIPSRGRCRVGYVQVDMVVRQGLCGSGGLGNPDGEQNKGSRKHNSLHENPLQLVRRRGFPSLP